MRDLKILIPLTGGTHWVGGVQYTRNLLRALSRLPASECPPIVVQMGEPNPILEDEFHRLPHVAVDRVCPPSSWRGRIGSWFAPPHRLADDCTVAFPLQTPTEPGPWTPIFWVPDFQDKHLPQFFPEAERRSRDQAHLTVFGQARFLVFSSQDARADFERFYPQFRNVNVRVLSFCTVLNPDEMTADSTAVCWRYGLPERFVYVPNQFWQHKGHDTVFTALALLRRGGITLPVVCTGNPNDYRNADYFQSLQRLLVGNGLANQVTMLGLLPRFDQIQVFRRAALVVQASRFEGWSTVVEDARALGRPLVLSDLGVHQEQAPPRSLFFRTGDAEHLANVLAETWPRCAPGPSTHEGQAMREADQRAISFARAFLAIAAEAHALTPPPLASPSLASVRRGAAYFLKSRTPRLAHLLRSLVGRRSA